MNNPRLILTLGAALLAIASVPASANCSGVSCNEVFVEMLYTDAATVNGGDIWIQTSGTEANLTCTANSGLYVKLPFNAGAKKELYALLMLALATDRPVTLRFVDASQDCVVAYAFMERS